MERWKRKTGPNDPEYEIINYKNYKKILNMKDLTTVSHQRFKIKHGSSSVSSRLPPFFSSLNVS